MRSFCSAALASPAEIAPAIFLFLKEIASANRAILDTYRGRGFALMDAGVFTATAAEARARTASAAQPGLRLQLLFSHSVDVSYVQ